MENETMKKTNHTGKRIAPLQAIKKYCKHHCCCDDRESWVNCTLNYCFLYPHRFGNRRGSLKKATHKTGHISAKNTLQEEVTDGKKV